jgi:putative glutamine amidotransferase
VSAGGGARRPRIGVTTYPRQGDERPSFTIPSAYVDAVRRAGGLPLLLAPGEESAGEVLRHVDGLVFSGGGDLDPAHFAADADADPHPTQYGVDEERDRFELALMRAALDAAVPTLAICRGLQILNVVRGGDLHVHLPDVVGEDVLHRMPERRPATHPVRLAEGCRLAALYGASHVDTVSWHHQAVNRLGRGLSPVGWAPDGTIEAVELADAPWLLAVQWHPEMNEGEGALFEALVDLARKRIPPA